MRKIRFYGVLAGLMMAANFSFAQNKQPESKEIAYNQMLQTRAAKIVQSLAISDSGKAHQAQALIVKQYADLNNVYTQRDSELKVIKAGTDKEKVNAQKEALEQKTTAAIAPLHTAYFKHLSKILTKEQVEGVKNGMTYNVLNVTFTAYQQMMPDLTEKQKKQIYEWLVEAREHAVDAESSEKKHAWFGKYKGRINNYLSNEGVDMKKAEADWAERRKAEKPSPAANEKHN